MLRRPNRFEAALLQCPRQLNGGHRIVGEKHRGADLHRNVSGWEPMRGDGRESAARATLTAAGAVAPGLQSLVSGLTRSRKRRPETASKVELRGVDAPVAETDDVGGVVAR